MLCKTMTPLLISAVLAALGCGGSTFAPPSSRPPGSGQGSGSGSGSNSIVLSPTNAAAGSPDLQLTVRGSNFDGSGVIQSEVVWSVNGSNTFLTRTVDSSTQITAQIPASLLTSPVTVQVFVEKWDRIEGTASEASQTVSFGVTAPILSLSPSLETLGTKGMRQFVATFNGNNQGLTFEQSGTCLRNHGLRTGTLRTATLSSRSDLGCTCSPRRARRIVCRLRPVSHSRNAIGVCRSRCVSCSPTRPLF